MVCEFFMPTQEVATPGAAEEVLTRSGEVVQLFRRPGLSQSATKTLLRKVRCCQLHSHHLSAPCNTGISAWLRAP